MLARDLTITLTNVHPPLGGGDRTFDLPAKLTGRRHVGRFDEVELDLAGAAHPIWVPWRQVPEFDAARMANLEFTLVD